MKETIKRNNIKRNDIILTAIFIIAAILFFTGYKLFFHKTGNFVQITSNGKIINSLPLNKDTTITINGFNNGKNILQIKNGYASIIDADCPDKLCQKQKKIRYNGESLVCLPHKVIVSVISQEKTEIDSIAG
ncbi:MAG: NusG domain II-containing protein [Lachnospiraceae bacterium]|nr:NusG domain II-containing protein [Lachnospiraceae bacterium]